MCMNETYDIYLCIQCRGAIMKKNEVKTYWYSFSKIVSRFTGKKLTSEIRGNLKIIEI